MEEKRCTVCGEVKPLEEFPKHPQYKDGHRPYCKACQSKRRKVVRHTKEGLIRNRYKRQKKSSKERGHPAPAYTVERLIKWALDQEVFHSLFEEWEASGFVKDLAPSFDRIDYKKPYILDNLQILTWRGNNAKGFKETANFNSKPVAQFDLGGNFIREYKSAKEASKETGVHPKNINRAASKENKTAGGYLWVYV